MNTVRLPLSLDPPTTQETPMPRLSLLTACILTVILGSVAIYAYVFFVTDASPPPTVPLGEYQGMQSKQ